MRTVVERRVGKSSRMMAVTVVVAVSLAVAGWSTGVKAEKTADAVVESDEERVMSPADCRAAGFLEGLVCSNCELAEQYLTIPDFKSMCMQCCEHVESVGSDSVKYPKAILEMCNCKLGAFPQIEPFVRGRMKKAFKNMKHKHINGAPPRLKLLNDKGKVAEVLNIEKWDTDTVTAFLNERLQQ